MGDTQSIRDLVDSRDKEYGQAWLVTGVVMSNMVAEDPQVFDVLHDTPYTYNWTIIQNKLHRLLTNPYHVDSWKDIGGYAELVVRHLEERNRAGKRVKVVRQGVPHEAP
jgi:hypothetical protein